MYILAIIPLLILSRLLYHLCHHLSSPLRSIPGPFWTRFSKVWYFNRVRRGHFEADNIHLHQKYGSVVRIAPNQYSVSDIAAVKTIYGTGSKFAKSDWYEGWKHPDPDRWTLFPDRDIKRHGMIGSWFGVWFGCADRRSGDEEAVLESVFDELVGAL